MCPSLLVLAIDLPAKESKINGKTWKACAKCGTKLKMAKILSCGHSSHCRKCVLSSKGSLTEPTRCPIPTCAVIIDGLEIFENPIRHCECSSTQDTVLDVALCNLIASENIEFIDCQDAPMPTSAEAYTKSWKFPVRDKGKFQVFSIDHYYECSLPSFIWRSLNALQCSVYVAEKSVIGTAPRNICEINGLRDSTIQVDLITRENWWRFGNAFDSVRFAFAFTFKKFELAIDKRTKNELSFDIAVWENYNDPGEWEIGFLHTSGRFLQATDTVMSDVEKNGDHPFYHLLRRAVQVMTGKQGI